MSATIQSLERATGFLEMLPYEKVDDIGKCVVDCADSISACMGYQKKNTSFY